MQFAVPYSYSLFFLFVLNLFSHFGSIKYEEAVRYKIDEKRKHVTDGSLGKREEDEMRKKKKKRDVVLFIGWLGVGEKGTAQLHHIFE